MFSSLFSSGPAAGQPTFLPVTSAFQPNEMFGELEPQDLEWLASGGFVTETQTWYQVIEDGTFVMCQVIHSSLGIKKTVQFVVKVYNPLTGEKVWKSVNVSNFVTPPPPSGGVTHDRRSCKANEFTVIHKSADKANNAAESYHITANLGKDLQLSLVVSRPETVPGWKFGKGPKGGYSKFGYNFDQQNEKKEGFVVHRFWPRTEASGHVITSGKAITVYGPGMFVHAIQGMRPNLVATRWNFANFQSNQYGGISAIQMEFTTLDQYGSKGAGSGGVKVNVGSLVVGGKLVAVIGETGHAKLPSKDDLAVKSRAVHLNPQHDGDTGYDVPSSILFEWAGPILGSGNIKAKLEVNLGSPSAPNGLIEKVDIFDEVPGVVKSIVIYATGAKPYIYQYLNPVTLELNTPKSSLGGNSDEMESVSIDGSLFNEVSFVS